MSEHNEQPVKKKTTVRRKRVSDPVKAKHRKINQYLMIALLAVSAAAVFSADSSKEQKLAESLRQAQMCEEEGFYRISIFDEKGHTDSVTFKVVFR